MARIRISWVQVMAILALFGIILGIVGTVFLYDVPVSQQPIQMTSGELTQ